VPRLVSQRAIGGRATTLRLEDAMALVALPDVAAAAPGADGAVRVKAGGITTTASAMGTTPAFLAVRGYRLAEGRFIEEADVAGSRRVAVLGDRVAAALFGSGPVAGREVRVRGVPFEVVGRLAPKGASIDGGDEDDQLVVPVTTALRRVFNRRWISAVFVSAARPVEMDAAAARVADLLRVRHRAARLPSGAPGAADFEVQNTARMVALQQQTLALLRWLTLALAAITVTAGGAGVLTLMWLSVSDRTTEIGLRLAVGASPADVFRQFLGEAALVAAAGWIAGLTVASVLTLILGWSTRWAMAAPPDAAALSAAMVAITALGPGLVPAARAARVAPVEALRDA
jgi:putative ABC transport system permease protein